MESTAVTPQAHDSPSGAQPLDAGLVRRLKSVAARLRGYLLIEGVAWFTGFLLAAFTVQFAFDYGTRGLRWSIRAALLSAIIAAALVVLWRRLLRPLTVRIDLGDVANLVERRFPHLSSALISAVRFAGGEMGPISANSPALAAAVVRRAGTLTAGANFNSVLDSRRAKRSALAILLIAGAGAAAALAGPSTARLWFARNVLLQDVPWPKRTHLRIEGAASEIVAARGDDLVIQATAEGVQPAEVEFFYTTVSGQRGRETMVTVGSADSYHYRYTFKSAEEDFEFYLRGGDDQTMPLTARLVDRPHVESSRMHVTPPRYTGLEPVTLPENERSAQLLPGSEVRIHIRTNKAVSKAVLNAGSEALTEAAPDGDGYVATFSPRESQTYHFALVDDLGFENREPVRFAIRVMKDEAPRVRLKVTGAGEMITPQALLPIELDFADTYGLAAAQLLYRLIRDEQREEMIELSGFVPGSPTFATSLAWPAAQSGCTPGDRLALVALSSDYDDVSGPNAAQSPETSFRVVTPDELLAELARREQEFRMDFERLIDAQEQLRGRVLSLMGPAAPPSGSAEFASTLADLERRQRSIAQSVGVTRQQVEQVLSELRINQLAGRETEERLGNRIAVPLGTLTGRSFPAAADSIRRWSRDAASAAGEAIDEQQVAILQQMREILANMIQWEGYQEAITMLRDILRLQNELKAETQDAVEKQGGDIFDK